MNQRIFIGVAPENWQAEQLLELQSAILGEKVQGLASSAKPTTSHNLHMTLAFLGMASADQVEQVCLDLDKMDKPKFNITLDTLTLWRRPQVLCISGQNIEPSLANLYRQCQTMAKNLTLHSNEHDFTPHITLFRKAKASPEIQIKPVVLSPLELHLYCSNSSTNGVEYSKIKSWKLN